MVTDRRKPENTEPPLTGRGDDGPKFKLAGTLAPVSPHPRSRSGPKTPKGKAAVAGNAIKHGIFARARVLPGVERPEEWEAHLNGVVADLAPDGDYVDTLLAEFAAVKFWALERVRRHGLAVLVRDQAQRDLELAQLVAKLAKQQGLPGWPVLELPDEARNRSLEHAKEQGFGSWWQLAALEEELRLAQVRRQPLDQLAKAGKSLPLEAAQNLLRALTDGEGLTGNRIPRAVQALLDSPLELVPASRVLTAVMALAASVEKPVSSLLLAATEDGRKGEETLRTLQAWVGTQREVLKGLQLLPDRDDLAQLSRYEASLFRDLQRTLYELEARKARRRGETVHLAQIQVETGPAAGSGG